jgi:hypothetical protein
MNGASAGPAGPAGPGAGPIGPAGHAGPSTTVADVIVPKGNFGSYPPKKKKRGDAYGQQLSDESVAAVLGQGHPKCQTVPCKR